MSLVSKLSADLTDAGYTVAALHALWGPDAAAALHRGLTVPARRSIAALREAASPLPPVAVLAECFILGRRVVGAELDSALPSLTAAGALRLGLVRPEGPGYVPALDLRPYSFVDTRGPGDWWILSDVGELVTGGPLPEGHVLGVGGASMTLSGLMFQHPVDSALDLGTGCGIQALHARRHAERVVATDISARALELAALNAELNGVDGIEFRLGSLFEPVAGERFDRIVSNPPFVITPRGEGVPEYEYRDGGMVGDRLVETVLTELAQHLEPGGTAQLLGNWEYRGGAAGSEASGLARVRDWLAPTGLDYWVIERDTQSPAEYAETWIRDGGLRPGERFDVLTERWLDDFAGRAVTGVGFGYLVLRKGEGDSPRLQRIEEQHGPLGGDEPQGIGAHLEECLRESDRVAALDDAELASVRLVTAADVTEERHYWPGQEEPSALQLRQGGGFGRVVTLDTALAGFVGACDGELPVGVIIDALAQLLQADRDALAAELLPAARELVTAGMLRLAG